MIIIDVLSLHSDCANFKIIIIIQKKLIDISLLYIILIGNFMSSFSFYSLILANLRILLKVLYYLSKVLIDNLVEAGKLTYCETTFSRMRRASEGVF